MIVVIEHLLCPRCGFYAGSNPIGARQEEVWRRVALERLGAHICYTPLPGGQGL